MAWPKGKPRGPQSPEHLARRMAAGAHAQKGVAQTPEHVEKGRQSRIGKKLNVTPARAAAVRQEWANGTYDDIFKRGQGFSYKGVSMRSNWEVAAAAAFDAAGLAWSYEPQRFYLRTSGRNYWPDFCLPDVGVWVEVKGYLTDEAKSKFDEFSIDYNAVMLRAETTTEFDQVLANFIDSVSTATGEATLQSI